jgi:hypothetical protein
MANGTIVVSIPIDVTGPQPHEVVRGNGLKAKDDYSILSNSSGGTKGKLPVIH